MPGNTRPDVRLISKRSRTWSVVSPCCLPCPIPPNGTPVPADKGWDAFADDQLGLMGHLGIREFFYMGYCIGGCFAGKLLQRAPDRIVTAVFHQSVGHRPEDPDVMMRHSRDNWLPDFRARRPEVPWTRSRSISTACGAPGNLARIARTLTQTSAAVARVTLDKASVLTLGFQIEDDRRHVVIADLGDQVALRQVEVKLDGLLNHGLQRRVSLDVIPHGLRRARPACGLEDLGCRLDNAGALPQCLLNLLDLETRLIHWNLWNLFGTTSRDIISGGMTRAFLSCSSTTVLLTRQTSRLGPASQMRVIKGVEFTRPPPVAW